MSQYDSFTTDAMIQQLTQWAAMNDGLMSSKVEIFVDPVCGLSLQAGEDIKAGTKFISCSAQMTLSYLNAIEAGVKLKSHGSLAFSSKSLQRLSTESPHIIGNYFLMQQYLECDSSFWEPYITILPQPGEFERLCIPAWWPDNDLKFLEGTNAHPAVNLMKETWYTDWLRGQCLVEKFTNASEFTYDLYKWAATIYGSRSFRASLTVPHTTVARENSCQTNHEIIIDHIENDSFSVLMPLIDIGNHNGINQVQLTASSDSGLISLENLYDIKRGTQIYNFYGKKINTELLVAYGFILPNIMLDAINLKLSPQRDALQIRKSQSCYVTQLKHKFPGQVNMFQINQNSDIEANDPINSIGNITFSHGFIDLLSCMVATRRERIFMLENPDCCLEHGRARFSRVLSRNMVQTWQLIRDKLISDITRLETIGRCLSVPQNPNQTLALEYRKRQINTLQAAHKTISHSLHHICRHNSLMDRSETTTTNITSANLTINEQEGRFIDSFLKFDHSCPTVELISLEYAYEECLKTCPIIYDKIMKFISEDQEEPLPLDWALMLPDWDQTYWVIWIATIFLLSKTISNTCRTVVHPPILGLWLQEMQRNYNLVLQMDPKIAPVAAVPTNNHRSNNNEKNFDLAEIQTIDEMILSIANELALEATTRHSDAIALFSPEEVDQAKQFALQVASGETIYMSCEMHHGSLAGTSVEQLMLCLNIPV